MPEQPKGPGGTPPAPYPTWKPGRPRKYQPGDIVRFTYDHQDVDDHTGGKYKLVLILNPKWHNKVHAIDLDRMSPVERGLVQAVLDPDTYHRPHPNPMVNAIRQRLDPLQLISNPLAFYTRFLRPFIHQRQIDIYRQYIPHRMHDETVVKRMTISGKPKVSHPLNFLPKPDRPDQPKTPLTPIDAMKAGQQKRMSPLERQRQELMQKQVKSFATMTPAEREKITKQYMSPKEKPKYGLSPTPKRITPKRGKVIRGKTDKPK